MSRETLTRLNDRRLNVPAGTPYVNTGVMVLNAWQRCGKI